MKILFLSRWFPYPSTNGSKLRIYNLLRGLANYHEVTLLSFADQPDVNPDAPEIKAICSEVHVVPWREFDPKSIRARFGFLSLTPRSLIDTFSSELAEKITTLINTQQFDLVIASQLSMASYRPYFRNIPAIFEEVEIGLTHDKAHTANSIERLRHAFTWDKLRIYLSQLLNSFQACTLASEQEYKLLTRNFTLHNVIVEVIPNCVNVNEYENHRATPVPNQLIFSGSFRYSPNYEAMLWYIEKVHPQVLEEIPDAHLVITGDHANMTLPCARNVSLVGYVDNIKALTSSSCASVAPLLSGGGTRLKILEAMAMGTPVIATQKGKEGITAQSGEHLLVADDPKEFAESVIRILRDKELRQQISSSAQQFVRKNYDWSVIMPKFLSLVDKAVPR
jgi:polysaccharide biosynthesis protein PslH